MSVPGWGIRRQCAALAGLVLIVYANSLDGGFYFDDHHSIERNTAIRSLAAIPTYFVDGGAFSADPDVSMYRPLLLVSYALNHALGGVDPVGYHLVNVLLHISFVILLFQTGRQLTRNPGTMWWWAAIVAVHPLNSQAVNYVSSRSGILAALGALGAFYLSSVVSRPRTLAAAASQLAGLLAKSTALPGIGLTALHEARRPDGRRLVTLTILGLAIVVYVVAARASGFFGTALDGFIRPLATQAMTQCKALAYYVYLSACPIHLSISHPFAESSTPTAAVVTGGLLTLTLVALGALGWWRRDLAGFGVLWFYGGLALTSAMPLYILFSEHRVYLSLGGLALLGAHLWRPLPGVRPFLVPMAVLLILSALTVQRNNVWQDELVLWFDASRQAPDDSRVWTGMGEAYYRRGETDSAFAAYRHSLDLRPDNEVPWNNLGVLYEEAGRPEPAEAAYKEALRLRPEWPEAQANLGRVLLNAGRADEAAPLLGRAAARSPTAGVLVNLGAAAAQDGRIDVAAKAFAEALGLEPDNTKARVNLAALRLEQALKTDASTERELWLREAARLSQAVLETNGERGHPEARLNLAAVYVEQGRRAEARQLYEDILQRDAASGFAHEGYGRLLLASGDPGAAEALRRGIELGATSIRSWQELGRAEAARGRWAAASAAFRAAADLAPGDPGPLYNLGEVNFQRWQQAHSARDPAAERWRDKAIEAYRAVNSLESGYRGSRRRLLELGVATP